MLLLASAGPPSSLRVRVHVRARQISRGVSNARPPTPLLAVNGAHHKRGGTELARVSRFNLTSSCDQLTQPGGGLCLQILVRNRTAYVVHLPDGALLAFKVRAHGHLCTLE